MIVLKLSFKDNEDKKEFEIESGELLSKAVDRSLKDIPGVEKLEVGEFFNVVVNGHLIEKDFWEKIELKEKDNVVITPRIGSGDSGQLFKQIVLIAVVTIASSFFPPAASLGNAFIVAGITIGATLALNALIPPPIPEIGGLGGLNDVDSSQMYSISGQSNQAKRLGVVPKVYGFHRMFPTIAVIPYTELSVDPKTGETVQYLYGVYDFGLGTPQISDIRIGDTPLTTDSFTDFDMRLVDPMKDDVDNDEWDENLESEFKYYSGKRILSQLSIDLINGQENIQFTDDNENGSPQEIILDFINQKGLYGFNAKGEMGAREIVFQIDFALAGTENWIPYNDMDAVESYTSIGGTDATDFYQRAASVPSDLIDDLVSFQFAFYGTYNSNQNQTQKIYIKPNQKRMSVVRDENWTVGAKVFYGLRYLGNIQSIEDRVSDNCMILTMDRNITSRRDVPFMLSQRKVDSNGTTVPGSTTSSYTQFRSSRSEASKFLISGKKQSPIYSNLRFTPKVPGQYQVRVRRVSSASKGGLDYLGNDKYNVNKQEEITWTGITTALREPPIKTDKRHVFLELRIKATNQLNGNIQNLSAIVSSVLPVYDPDTGNWSRQVTNNPAWVFCDLLTGEVNKKAVPISRLHMDSIVEWAEYCAEVPTSPPSKTYLEPRFQSNFILDYDVTLQNLLLQVGGSAQASLNIIEGKYGVLLDRFRDVPVQIFTPRNSSGFSSSRIYGPRPHAVKVKYIDPQLGWEVQEVIAYDNGYNRLNATEFDELTAFACTNYEQAWRFGRYMIAQNKLRQETINILVDFENLVCTRGDYVQLTQDVMRVGGTPARVRAVAGDIITIDDSLSIDPDISYGYVYRSSSNGEIKTDSLTPVGSNQFQVAGDIPAIGDLIVVGELGKIVYDCIVKSISPNDDLSANITLVEKADAIFEYESTDVLPDYDPQISVTSDPNFKPPKAVTDLTLGDNFWECSVTQSGYTYYAEVVWNMPPGSVFEFFEIWVNDGRGYKAVGTTTVKYYRYDVGQSQLDVEHGIKVVAVSASGKKLQLVEMPEVLFTPMSKTAPPSDVEALNMSITNQVLQLSWTPIDDCDCKEYVLRYSPDANDVWESSIPLQTVSKNVSSVAVQARTGVYLIKAIDFNDNQSVNSAIATTTVPNLFDLNIIETMNEAPDFPGVLDNTELLGEAVILKEAVIGDDTTTVYETEGAYEFSDLLDLDDIYTVRLQSLIRADGLKKGELMSDWESLEDVEHLNTSLHSDWDVALQYRATDIFASMASWQHLYEIEHLNYGAGVGFTEWRDIPTVGDATGRIFQFRIQLFSLAPNVTPRLFDATVNADMPDRTDSFENEISHATEAHVISYDPVFKGPGTTPNVQISIDDGESGDYWTFDYKTLEGLAIRFYNKDGIQVSRQFDLVAKGYGRRHTVSL